MFLHAMKLCNLTWSDRYGENEVKSVTTRISTSLLSALEGLSLLDSPEAYIKTPTPVILYENVRFNLNNRGNPFAFFMSELKISDECIIYH
jgi:hypothetical protein